VLIRLERRSEPQRLAIKQQLLLHAVDNAALLHEAVALAFIQHVHANNVTGKQLEKTTLTCT
jgi:hypothetical protein